jgi:hypothetical protein
MPTFGLSLANCFKSIGISKKIISALLVTDVLMQFGEVLSTIALRTLIQPLFKSERRINMRLGTP